MSDETIFEVSQEEYQRLFDQFEEKVEFKGYNISTWLQILDIKDLPFGFSTEDLERFTLKVINQTDLVYTNHALAQANYIGLKRSVEKAMMRHKQEILEEIDAHNRAALSPADKKKYPNNDTLESLAYNRCSKLQLSLCVAEMFNAFWETQSRKIFALNQRMTSLSVSKNMEMKMSSN